MPRTERIPGEKPQQRGGNQHAKPRGKDKSGVTKIQRRRLEEAWSMELPDTQACHYAGITIGKLRTLYEKDPTLRNYRDILKETPFRYARKNVSQSLKSGDMQTTKWFLEKRDKEYANKASIDVNVQHSLDEQQILERLSRFIPTAVLEQLNTDNDDDVIDVGPANGAAPELEYIGAKTSNTGSNNG